MKELKSKKTGLVQLISEEQYSTIVNAGTIDLRRFIVTDIRSRIIPSIKLPNEIKKKK
jgi:hypothetical protein